MIHAMIDLETLSTNPNAVILTLGAVKFNPFGTGQSEPMYFKVDVDSQTKLGRHVQPETLDWWATQPKKIQEEALGESDRISLEETLKKINKYSVGVDVFWCQGPLFDYAILQNLYAQMGQPCPWNYWAIRDSRTLFSLVPRDPNEKRLEAHNALADCYHQAKKVQKVYKDLGVKNV
jgi:hypothetical protein